MRSNLPASAHGGAMPAAQPDWFRTLAMKTSYWAGRPVAFVGSVAVILAWAVTGPVFGYSDTWQLVINTGTTIVTFLMVFLIQATQNRDAAAIQLKLDELLRAMDKARDEVMGVEERSDAELAELKSELNARGAQAAQR